MILQLVILPVIGTRVGDVEYGLIITLVSLSTLLSQPFGNVLNNIRLLTHKEYEDHGVSGDFNILLAGAILINACMMVIGTIYYAGSDSFLNVGMMIILSCLTLTREYVIVTFRITLNYKAILMNNIILGIGYLAGMLVFWLTGYWQSIYIIGSALSLIYVMRHSSLLKEKLTRTPFFKQTTYKSIILFISVFMKTILNYGDKLLLFPLLGPATVSVYYSATVLGKIISMAITPVSSVMLSYLAKMEKMKMKQFLSVLSITFVVGVIGYFVTFWISGPVLQWLYPKWAEESLRLIPITTATAIMEVMCGVIHPIVLRFNHMNWQIVISGTNVIIYLTGVLILYHFYGLVGFSIGILAAGLFKLLLMISIFVSNDLKKEQSKRSADA